MAEGPAAPEGGDYRHAVQQRGAEVGDGEVHDERGERTPESPEPEDKNQVVCIKSLCYKFQPS